MMIGCFGAIFISSKSASNIVEKGQCSEPPFARAASLASGVRKPSV